MTIRYFNKIFVHIVFTGFLFGIPLTGIAQCVPDTSGCKNEGESSQVCPDSIPNGMQGVEYHQVITFIMPDSVSVGNLVLTKIRLDTVENLPAGIRFISAEKEFYPDSVYCFELTGNPDDTGTFHIKITLTPFVDVLGNEVAMPPQSDSTNIIMRIEAPSGVDNIVHKEFSLIPGYPNPFRLSTRIGFYSQKQGSLELVIYNMIGEIIYREHLFATGGKAYFKFTGEDLPSGIYIYTVMNRQTSFKAKLVKTK